MKEFSNKSKSKIAMIAIIIASMLAVSGVCYANFKENLNAHQVIDYIYASNHVSKSVVEDINGIKLVYIKNLDSKKQRFSPKLVKNTIDKLDLRLKSKIKEVRIVDWENPNDELFGIKLASQVLPKSNSIEIYENGSQFEKMGIISEEDIQQQILMVLTHEAMHIFDLCGTEDQFKMSTSELWSEAVIEDAKMLVPENKNKTEKEEMLIPFVTKYAGSSYNQGLGLREDLADFAAYYLNGFEDYKNTFPNRATALEKILATQ